MNCPHNAWRFDHALDSYVCSSCGLPQTELAKQVGEVAEVPFVNCPHGGSPAWCTLCALVMLEERAPDVMATIMAFGARQLAIIEALATCAHRHAIASAAAVVCVNCGARRVERKWVRSDLGVQARILDKELKASALRSFRAADDSDAKNVIPIKSRT